MTTHKFKATRSYTITGFGQTTDCTCQYDQVEHKLSEPTAVVKGQWYEVVISANGATMTAVEG